VINKWSNFEMFDSVVVRDVIPNGGGGAGSGGMVM